MAGLQMSCPSVSSVSAGFVTRPEWTAPDAAALPRGDGSGGASTAGAGVSRRQPLAADADAGGFAVPRVGRQAGGA